MFKDIIFFINFNNYKMLKKIAKNLIFSNNKLQTSSIKYF